MKEVNKDSPLPLYYQLKDLIMEKIELGEYKSGDKLPTEEELCEKYNLSRTTVRNALKDLENKGLIRRERSLGTFISMAKISQGPKILKSFTEDMIDKGYTPYSKELERKVIKSHGIISKKLQIEDGEKVTYIKRLRFADDKPMGIQEAFLPYSRFPALLSEVEEIKSLYSLLNEKYNVVIKYAKESYRAVLLNEVEAALLESPDNSPAFYVERTSFDLNERPIEFVKSLMRADRYEVTVDLSRG